MAPTTGRIRRYWVVEWSGGGGFGHYAWFLADGLARIGAPTVLATRTTHELGDLPHRHTDLGLWPAARPGRRSWHRSVRLSTGRAAGWVRLLVGVARGGRSADVVHLHTGARLPELPFIAALRLTGATIVVTAHNVVPHDSGLVGRLAQRVLYRSAHGLVAHTEQAAAEIERFAGGRPRFLVMPHPSAVRLVDQVGTAAVPTGPLRAAHLGTIRPYKGFDRVVDAVVAARVAHPALRFCVVGWPADEEAVGRALSRLSADAVERTFGHVPIASLVDAARAADVVVLGHTTASESGVAHLALAAGAAVIGPRNPTIARLLATEPTWLYAPGDAADAGRALTEVLAAVEADRPGVRRRARAVADAVLDWDEAAARTWAFAADLREGTP